MKTILVLSSHTPSLFWFRMDMMRAFIGHGIKVIAAGPESLEEWHSKFDEFGIEYRSIPVSRNGLNVLADIKTYFALINLITESHPYKIFTYQAKTIVYGTLAAHKVNPAIDVYPLVAGLGSIFRGTGLKNKIIRKILSVQYKITFRYSKKVIFQNGDDKNELINRRLLKEDKTRIINGSGVDISKFAKTQLPLQKAILFIGRLIRDKGIGEYLALCKQIKKTRPDIRCLLVGPFDTNPSAISHEELRPYIEKKIIEYYGEQKDVRPYLAQCSVYILPSYHEGTPKTVLEAMAVGRPIVTTYAPGCRETVEDGVNGFLVPIKDVNALTKAVMSIIDNPCLAEKFGKESRRIAEKKYDVNKVNAEIMKIMEI